MPTARQLGTGAALVAAAGFAAAGAYLALAGTTAPAPLTEFVSVAPTVAVPDVPAGTTASVMVPFVARGRGPLRVVGSAGTCDTHCCFDLMGEAPYDLPPDAAAIECKLKATAPGNYTIPLVLYVAGDATQAFQVTATGTVTPRPAAGGPGGTP
jgi:hypothetical protein